MGFCHVAAGPAELVSLDSFYVGQLKGVGRVYQLTAVDVFTRWAVVALSSTPPRGRPRAASRTSWFATGAVTATSCEP